jgi:DNA-binding response OmpR family regulator
MNCQQAAQEIWQMAKILVVDDEQGITDGLVALFGFEEIEADGAYDRAGAEAMLENADYSLVLADLRLVTEADGKALIASIRRRRPDAKIATLTAFATPEVEEELLALGSECVLRKPMEFDEIVAVVREMLTVIETRSAILEKTTGAPVDLETLYLDVRRVLHALPQRRYGLTSEETEELVQEAWCLFLQKHHSITMPRAWLSGTVLNLCKQQIHQKARTRSRTEDVDSLELHAPETRSAHDARVDLNAGLTQLDERGRQLCVLIGLEGW